MMDLHIVHDRFGSSTDPNLNGHLHYPNDIDRSLNESVDDKIRNYRYDYNHNPPNAISFMTVIVSVNNSLFFLTSADARRSPHNSKKGSV